MSQLYPAYKEAILTAGVNLTSLTIKGVLLKSSHTPNTAHDFLDDITAGDMVGTAQTLGSKTVALGVFDAADITFTAVGAAAACDKVLLYADSGVSSTSRLIGTIDLGAAVTPNGGDITVQWSNGSNKIFALT